MLHNFGPHMIDVRDDNLVQALKKLKSLRDGDVGVYETIGCGKRAIPALRELLFEREPSGLFETRCRVVQILAALDARDALVKFLTDLREAADSVERLGDDAVVNAAARALAKYRDGYVFQLLWELARRRPLPGVIAALGSFGRRETIPCLIDALAEDECRSAAEAALEKQGIVARAALKQAFEHPLPPDSASASQMRQRLSILRLLVKVAGRNKFGCR
jgi:hypothetical protein